MLSTDCEVNVAGRSAATSRSSSGSRNQVPRYLHPFLILEVRGEHTSQDALQFLRRQEPLGKITWYVPPSAPLPTFETLGTRDTGAVAHMRTELLPILARADAFQVCLPVGNGGFTSIPRHRHRYF